MRHRVMAVVGPGDSSAASVLADAGQVGRLAAESGWVVMTGGRPAGVMEAALEGARGANGLTVAVIPGDHPDEASPFADFVVASGSGEGRNNLIVLSADVIVACGMNPGTASEVSLALRHGRPVILVAPAAETRGFFERLDTGGRLHIAATPADAVALAKRLGWDG